MNKKWIFFTDKGNINDNHYDIAFNKLSEKSKKRRITTSNMKVNFNDLEMNNLYINQLNDFDLEIISYSKWLNAVVISYNNELVIEKIQKLHFVKKIQKVRQLKNNAMKINYGFVDVKEYIKLSNAQLDLINVKPLHNAGYKGEDVSILVIDTGYNLNHECLLHIKHKIDDDDKKDFIYNDNNVGNESIDYSSQDDHGTYILSVIGGYAYQKIEGVAKNASYLLAKTENLKHEKIVEEYDFVEALEWGESKGADIMTASLGYIDWYEFNDLNGDSAITTIAINIAAENGITCICAAGNEGTSGIIAPADSPNIISTGAVDLNGTITSFSSRGPTADNRIKPEICALGANTFCANPNYLQSYSKISGTSLAAPMIGGVCALLLQKFREKFETDIDQYEKIQYNKIIRDAILLSGNNKYRPNNDYGWGLIDAAKAFEYEPIILNPGWNTFNFTFMTRLVQNNIISIIDLDTLTFFGDDIEVFEYNNNQYDKVTSVKYDKGYYIFNKSTKKKIVNLPNDFSTTTSHDLFRRNLDFGWNLIKGVTENTKFNDMYNLNDNDIIYLHNDSSNEYILLNSNDFAEPGKLYWIKHN